MKKNPDLTIRIEGHVNNPTSLKIKNPNSAQHNQWLSEARARTVYNYLLRKNIDKGRMSTAGYGDSQMLFPDALTEEEMMQNRRVEIKVVSFGPEKSQ